MPKNASPAKVSATKWYGADVILEGTNYDEASTKAKEIAQETGAILIHAFDDPDIIAGQGTIGFELLEQLPNIDNVYISMGGGGLISGIGSVIKYHSPTTKIIGVSAINSGALAASIKLGSVCETAHFDTLADGCAGGIDEGTLTLPIAIPKDSSSTDVTGKVIDVGFAA